jgi:acetate kinase
MNILVLNAGSSSLKFQLIATDLERIHTDSDERLCRGSVDHFGERAEFVAEAGEKHQRHVEGIADVHAALQVVLDWVASTEAQVPGVAAISDIHAVGHRIVHGGERFSESTLITEEVLGAIRDCIDLAPLHNPKNIEGVLAARKSLGADVPQVAVFDTAFHHTLPQKAYLYPVPLELYEKHRIRRYGFHGTSHRYVAHRYRALNRLSREQTNIISLHLGNGCSAAAIKGGESIDTSMGMTPLEGLMMGTRSGDIDPSLVEIIARQEGLSLQDVDGLLNTRSGLLGISGVSNDMRELCGSNQPRSALAVTMFGYRAKKYIGAFLAAMGGADAVVFTGGIGEHSPSVRSQICDGLEWAGLSLDPSKNEAALGTEARLSTNESKLAAFCIPTDEEMLIARDTARCILGEPNPS